MSVVFTYCVEQTDGEDSYCTDEIPDGEDPPGIPVIFVLVSNHVSIEIRNPEINKNTLKDYQEWMKTKSEGQCGTKWLRFYAKSCDGDKVYAGIQLLYCKGYAEIASGLLITQVPLHVGIDVIKMLAERCTNEEDEDSEEEEDKEEDKGI